MYLNAGSPERLNILGLLLIPVGPQYGPRFISPLLRLQLSDDFYIFEKMCLPVLEDNRNPFVKK